MDCVALFKRSLESYQQGRPAEASAVLREVLRLRPDHFDALHLSAVIADQSGQTEQSAELLSRAIALNALVPAAHRNLGSALVKLRRLEEAVACYDRAIALRPDFAQAHCGRAGALVDLDRPSEAIESCRRVLELAPNSPDAYVFRGAALIAVNRPAQAIASFDAALSLRPNDPLALNGRGSALNDLQQPEAAVENLQEAVALAPAYAEAWNNLGIVRAELGRHEEAQASFERAISLTPGDARPYLNAAHACLQVGRFERGWELYEWRAKLSKAAAPPGPVSQPSWSGSEDIEGKTLYLHSEQGLGDTIQFCRYARLAELRGARVVMSVQDGLVRLLSGLSPTIDIVGEGRAPASFDFHCPLLSMPRAFGTRLETVPAGGPYLSAEPQRSEHWRRILGEDGLKVGICWQGALTKVDIGRSFPLDSFRRLATLPAVRLISLQKRVGSEQLASLPEGMKVETLGADFDAGADAFLDSAAVIANLDLVVTSDTAIAHLAGALGRTTWVVLKHSPDWRWLLQRADCPWYPSHRLFRQHRPGDWNAVFDEVYAALQDFHFSRYRR